MVPSGQTGGLWGASSSKAGFNVIAAGFPNPITATSFSATVGTSVNLNDIVAKGVEWVRVPVNPTGALAATDSGTETKQIHYARDAIKRCIDKGLKVMLSVHVSGSDTGWTTVNIIQAYPSSAKWLRYLHVLRRYAEMAKQFPADKLIVHLWNEVDSSTAAISAATWNAAMRVAAQTFRSRNRRNCIAISGTQFSSVDGIADLTPYSYEPRAVFCFTPYEPHTIFTHQGVTTVPILLGISRLSRPPIPSERTTVYANIDGSGMSAGDKVIAKGYVDNYLDTPYDAAYVDARVNLVSTWATNNKVNNRKIVVSEYGCHGDFSANGATEVSRALWFAEMRQRIKAKGYAQNIWHYDDDFFGLVNTGSFTLNDRFLTALNLTSTTSYETEAATLFAADGVARSFHAKAVANATIKMLKDNSLWAKLGCLYLTRCEDLSQGKLNWKTPGSNTIVPGAGSLTWSAAAVGNGVVAAGDGTARYLSCAYALQTGPERTDNVSMGVMRISDDGLDGNRVDFVNEAFSAGIDGHGKAASGYRGASGGLASTGTGGFNNTMVKHAAFSITDATHQSEYDNGSLIRTKARTSAALGTSNMLLFGNGSFYSGGQISGAWIASGLTDAEMATLHTILTFYDTAF